MRYTAVELEVLGEAAKPYGLVVVEEPSCLIVKHRQECGTVINHITKGAEQALFVVHSILKAQYPTARWSNGNGKVKDEPSPAYNMPVAA